MKHLHVTAAALLALGAAGCGGPERLEPAQALARASTAGGIASFRLSSTTVTAGGSITATISLRDSGDGSGGGAFVYLSFPAGVLAGPRLLHIPGGSSSGTATFHADPFLSAAASATITASTSSPQPSSFILQTLSVMASPTPPTTARPEVAALTLDPAAVTSGSPVTGTITLTGPAPEGGAAVQLSSSNDFFNRDADVPPVVVVPAGATSADFVVQTHISGGAATYAQAIIVGSYFGGIFQGAYLTIESP
jgi:hypothetical protein